MGAIEWWKWRYRLIAILLSFSVWYFVVGSGGSTDIIVTAPIELINIPNNIIIKSGLARHVEIRMRGNKNYLKNIGSSVKKITCRLDLSKLQNGENEVNLTRSSVDQTPGLRIISMNPQTLKIVTDIITQKSLKIIPDISYPHFSPIYTVKEITVFPKFLNISAPSSSLKSIENIKTEPIIINLEKPKFWSGTVQIILPADAKSSQNSVSVHIIFATATTKIKYNLPIGEIQNTYGLSVKPINNNIKLELEVTDDKVSNKTFLQQNIKLLTDAHNINSTGEQNLSAKLLILDDDIKIIGTKNITLRVLVKTIKKNSFNTLNSINQTSKNRTFRKNTHKKIPKSEKD